MDVQNIAHGIVVASRCRINQPRQVVILCPLNDFRRFELPPRLVERHPDTYRRRRIQIIDDFFPFFFINSLRFWCTFTQRALEISVCNPARTFPARRHVLPHYDAETVAPVVPTCWLHFHMFANHVIAKIFCLLNVVPQSFVARSGVEAVAPPALIERAEHENRLVVEHQTHNAVLVLCSAEFAHREVTDNIINKLIPLIHRHVYTVKERIIRRPKYCIDRHCNFNSFTIYRPTFTNNFISSPSIFGIYFDFHLNITGCIDNFRNHCNCMIVYIRNDFQIFNICLVGHHLKPYRLPYSSNWCVPDSMRFHMLLSTRLLTLVCRIPNADFQHITFLFYSLSDIESKWRVTASMRAHFYVIDPHIAFPIDSTEMQQKVLFSIQCVVEFTLIPEFFVFSDIFLHSRK